MAPCALPVDARTEVYLSNIKATIIAFRPEGWPRRSMRFALMRINDCLRAPMSWFAPQERERARGFRSNIRSTKEPQRGAEMDMTLTRRNLFRAFRPGEAMPAPEARVAQIDASCVEPRGVTCRRCGEACDVSAIKFTLMRGGARPRLDIATCTGCGECAPVCPVNAISLIDRDRALLAASAAAEATS